MRTRTLALAGAIIVGAFPATASAATLMGSDLPLAVHGGASNNEVTTFVQSQQRTLSTVPNTAYERRPRGDEDEALGRLHDQELELSDLHAGPW